MDFIYFIFLPVIVGIVSGALTEEKYTKFEYEYKVLERIVELEHDHKDMKNLVTKIKELEDVNHETTEILESQTDTISHLTETVKLQEDYIKDLKKDHDADIDEIKKHLDSTGDSASVYTRWGRSDCPGNGTELVYAGYVGGSWFDHKGGASNYVCLTKEPLWGHIQSSKQGYAFIFGAEYQFSGYTGYGKDFFSKNLRDFEPPCAVCRTNRPSIIMIPGRNKCIDGWTLEYHGYLAASYHVHALSTEYTCLDKSISGVSSTSGGNQDGALFYLVEARCGSLKCPPYVENAELTCAVCSK